MEKVRKTRRTRALVAEKAVLYEENKDERAGRVAMGYCLVRNGSKGILVCSALSTFIPFTVGVCAKTL